MPKFINFNTNRYPSITLLNSPEPMADPLRGQRRTKFSLKQTSNANVVPLMEMTDVMLKTMDLIWIYYAFAVNP